MKRIISLLLLLLSFAFSFEVNSTTRYTGVPPKVITVNGITYYYTHHYSFGGNTSCSGFVSNTFMLASVTATHVQLFYFFNNNGLCSYRPFFYNSTNPCPDGGDWDGSTCQNVPLNCDPDTEEELNGQCVPKCSPNSTRQSDGTCECNSGYSGDTCEPDISCPASMIYEAKEFLLLTQRRCIPNPDLTPEQCANIPNSRYRSLTDIDGYMVPLFYGSGCYDIDYAQRAFLNEAIDYAIAWAPLTVNADDIIAIGLTKLFNKGKNLWDDIVKAFRNSDDVVPPNLKTHEPTVTGMRMGEDGVMFEITPTPRITSDAYNNAAYQKFLKDNGISPKPNDPTPPTDFNYPRHVSPINEIDDLFYKGGDATQFNNTMLGTANLARDNVLPSLSGVGQTQTQTVTSMKSNIGGTTQTATYPTTLQKVYENTMADGTIQLSYKGHITYPDATKTQLTINQLKYPDGTTTSTVKASYDFQTTSGSKIFQTEYVTTQNQMGEILNSVKKPSTITKVNSDGSVSTTTNNPDPTTISQTEPAVNIQPLYDQLKAMNAKIDEIMNHKPQEADAIANALKNLGLALTDWDVSIQDAFDFLGGAKDQITGFFDKFDEAKAVFEDEPTIDIPMGTCPFNISGKNRTGGPTQTYTIDPCRFVAPYRPILSIFFTVLLTFSVLVFAFKHMFSVGGKS